jgi:hypothetical protein
MPFYFLYSSPASKQNNISEIFMGDFSSLGRFAEVHAHNQAIDGDPAWLPWIKSENLSKAFCTASSTSAGTLRIRRDNPRNIDKCSRIMAAKRSSAWRSEKIMPHFLKMN